MKFKNFISLTLSMVMTTSLIVSTASAAPSTPVFSDLNVVFTDTNNVKTEVTTPSALIKSIPANPATGEYVSEVAFKDEKVSFAPASSATTITSLTVQRIPKVGTPAVAEIIPISATTSSTALLFVGKNKISFVTDTVPSSTLTTRNWEVTRALGYQEKEFIKFNNALVSNYTTSGAITGSIVVGKDDDTFNVKVVNPLKGDYNSTAISSGASLVTTATSTSNLYADLETTGVDFKFDSTDKAIITITQTDVYDSTNSFKYTFEISREEALIVPTDPTEGKVNVYFYDDRTSQPIHTIEVDKDTVLGDKMPANPTKSNYTFNNWYTEVSSATTSATSVVFTKDTVVTGNTEVYSDWTYNSTTSYGGSSSSGGGGSYTKAPINNNSTVPSTENSVTTTAGDNLIKNLLAGNKAVAIDLGTKTSLELGEKSFADLIKADKSLTVTKGTTSIVISTALMKNLGLDSSGKVVISISAAKNATVTGAEGIDAKNKDLLALCADITIKADGKEITTFTSPLTITIDASKVELSDAQKANATGVRVLSNGKVNQLGGSFTGGKFTMQTFKLSQYGVMISKSFVKVLATVGTKSFTVNGQSQSADVAPMISDGRTMVPLRFIAEAFGAEVSWAKGTKTATIVLDGKTVTARVGSLSAGMDVAPFIEDGRTMVPLRYISEQLDANVIWNSSSRTIEINR